MNTGKIRHVKSPHKFKYSAATLYLYRLSPLLYPIKTA